MGRHTALGAAVLALATLVSVAPSADAATATRHVYVDNAVLLPTTNTEAAAYARNLDGSPGPDNGLGQFFATLAAQGLDLTGMESGAVSSGQLIALNSLVTPSLANAKKATWQVKYGNPTETPDFSGSGTFTVDPLAARSARIPAKIRNHHVSTAAANVPLTLDFGAGPATLSTVNTRIFATCSRKTCTGGRINGAIRETTLDDTLIPGLVALFQPIIVRDCPTGYNGCLDQSTGKSIEQLFDTDQDGTVTEQELLDNPLVQSILAPDLDLFDADGHRGHDGVNDSLSFGIGFTAVRCRLG